MIVEGSSLISRQLSITETTEVTFPGGHHTTLTPMRVLPQISGAKAALCLDGTWRCTRWPFTVPETQLAAPETADADWESVPQPGKVFYSDPEAEKDEIPDFDRVGLKHIKDDDGAVLRRSAIIPAGWTGKRIYLRFDAIFPAGRVYLNGRLLGEHTSGLTPAEYDVTGLVTPGQPVLVAVRLMRKHKFVKMDMVRHALEFGGLAQSACFHVTEPVQVADYYLRADLSADLAVGSLAGTVMVRNLGAESATGTVSVALVDPAGRKVASRRCRVSVAAGASAPADLRLEVRNPQRWNDEFPNLYTVTISLTAPGQAAQKLTYRTGFRRLDLSPEGPKLNGTFVKFRGVNHLTYHPDYGMYTPRAWLEQNLRLMKKANVNAIRTHFLGNRCLADLCDELGIYLLQELPVDWGTNYIHDPEWVGPALMRIEGGIRRDRHHPSIVVWSIGNENMPQDPDVAADGWNHLRIYNQFAKILDPSRATMFPPPGPANKIKGIFEVRVGDVADTHYSFVLAHEFLKTGAMVNPRSWKADMEATTRDEALAKGWSGVWFSSEYGIVNMIPELHNNPYLSIIDDVQEDILSGKNSMQVFIDRMKREWGFMRREATCLGGAYFPWLCSGSGKGPDGNPWGWVRWGEDADWGVVTADLLPKPYFWVLRTMFSPVWFPERIIWEPGQTEVSFQVQNQYNAIDLKDCTLRTMMGGGGKWMGMMRKFKDIPVSCAPGATTTVTIPIWNKGSLDSLAGNSPIAIRCILLDPKGFRSATTDIVVVPRAAIKTDTPMPVGPDAE